MDGKGRTVFFPWVIVTIKSPLLIKTALEPSAKTESCFLIRFSYFHPASRIALLLTNYCLINS